jgi:hypothetical protein
MRWVAVFLSCFVVFAIGDQHLNANGPFGKRHTINDEPSPYACKRGPGLSTHSKMITETSLNVSAVVYSSREQITVSWAPLSTMCKDDFVGVYFTDIAIEDGKHLLIHSA